MRPTRSGTLVLHAWTEPGHGGRLRVRMTMAFGPRETRVAGATTVDAVCTEVRALLDQICPNPDPRRPAEPTGQDAVTLR
jgi:hypothetical protein